MRGFLLAALAVALVASLASAYVVTVFSGTNCTGTSFSTSVRETCTVQTVNGRTTAYTLARCGATLFVRSFGVNDTRCTGQSLSNQTADVGVCVTLESDGTSFRYRCSASSVAVAVVIVASVVAMLLLSAA
jgi:hypothetical protein